MDQIYETNDKFSFNNLNISKPISASSGMFISRYSINEKPLYIQPPKCIIKQMVLKTGKRMYCDLVFNQENEQFIRWMENLENTSQQLIFNNREKWFKTELDMDDIENSFTSPMKIYKSGKSYIVRTNISNRLGKPILKVYDEDESDIPYEQLKEGTNVMVILEIQGIRCSARSFQIDIDMKQIMVLKTEDLFNTCILKKIKSTDKVVENNNFNTNHNDINIDNSIKIPIKSSFELSNELVDKNFENDLGKVQHEENLDNQENFDNQENLDSEENIDNNKIKIDTDNSNELHEVEFNLDEIPEIDTFSIKKRNDVYYEMYREARQKAKVARDLALSAYLEAKRIKNTYMLDDIINSSDEENSDEENSDEDESIENNVE